MGKLNGEQLARAEEEEMGAINLEPFSVHFRAWIQRIVTEGVSDGDFDLFAPLPSVELLTFLYGGDLARLISQAYRRVGVRY